MTNDYSMLNAIHDKDITIHVAASLTAMELLQDAYGSFIKHAAEIFADDTVNPATGQTVYADIETAQVWKNLVGIVFSEEGLHKAAVSVAKNSAGETVGFCFGIYHAHSNTANLTYTGVDEEYRRQGIGARLEDAVLGSITRMAKVLEHDYVAGLFVEVESSKTDTIASRAYKDYVPALNDWRSPLLITDGEGGYVEQSMTLQVKWNEALTDEERAETTIAFARDFYALYGNPLSEGGIAANGNRLYPATPSIDYQDKDLQAENLNAMTREAYPINQVPLPRHLHKGAIVAKDFGR